MFVPAAVPSRLRVRNADVRENVRCKFHFQVIAAEGDEYLFNREEKEERNRKIIVQGRCEQPEGKPEQRRIRRFLRV